MLAEPEAVLAVESQSADEHIVVYLPGHKRLVVVERAAAETGADPEAMYPDVKPVGWSYYYYT